MRHNTTIFGIFLILLTVSGLSVQHTDVSSSSLESFSGEKGTIRISGGTAHIPVMREAAERIMKFNPEIRITIAGGGSGAGIRQVGEGLVNIGNSGRRATETEISKYNLHVFELAVDGIAVIVHPGNQVKDLSSSALRGIYNGRITNWQELGGKDKPITVYTRDNSSGTRAVFWDKAIRRSNITDRALFAVSNGAMKAAVSQDPNGIGYISAGFIDESVSPVSLDGISPGLKNIRTGKYPVSRRLYSNVRGKPSSLVMKFINYLLAGEGQAIFQEKGFMQVQ